jgi:sugar phosphate isomerase/epimerase
MKPGFMSSVCPRQTLDELIASARRHGYEGIEFRGQWKHAHGVEPESTVEERATIRRRLSDSGVVASCVASGVKFNSEDAAQQEAQLETLRRYVALAADVGARHVRVFGDRLPTDNEENLEETLKREAECFARADGFAGDHGVAIALETHGNLRADHARRILDLAGCQNLRINWHIGHHIGHGQSVDAAYSYIKGEVVHVHLSKGKPDTMTDADNIRSLRLLRNDGFDGFVSVEVINPEDSEAVLAEYIALYKSFMTALSAQDSDAPSSSP